MPTNGAGRNSAGYSTASLIKHGETACCQQGSFSVFHFIQPVILFSAFPDGEILLAKVYPVSEICGPQPFHVLVHFRVRNLRVNLRGGNRGMSHHPAYRLYRNAERKGDVGTEIMPGHMKGQIKTIYLPQFPSQQDKIPAGINIEHLVSASLVAVFLYDLKRNIQQTDRRERIGLFRWI